MTLEQKRAQLYRSGWMVNGEWLCLKCETLIGKNLLNEKPFLLARQHVEKCCVE